MRISDKKCFWCGKWAHHGHHVYLRANAPDIIPLCFEHHREAHDKHYFLIKLQKAYERQVNDSYYCGLFEAIGER